MNNIEKRELVYNSGLKLFKKFGPKKVSIDMIVNEAGVGKGTFYNYFKNKEDLYETIIGDIVSGGKKYMNSLVEKFPEPKERLMVDFLSSLDLFCNKNGIIGNLMHNNPDYYLGKIDSDFLENTHMEMVSILFSDIMDTVFRNKKELIDFAMSIFGFYKHANSMRRMYKTEKEFKDFMTKLAYFFIEGLFSNTFDGISKLKYSDYEDKIKLFTGKKAFINKY